jgi:hypothetical protein
MEPKSVEVGKKIRIDTANKPRGAEKPDDVEGTTRRQFLRIFTGAVAMAAIASDGQKKGKKERHESREMNEITLGNVTFNFQNSNVHSAKEKAVLFRKMRSAYNRLTGYFGEDIMTMQEPSVCPIVIDKSHRRDAEVRWKGANASFFQDGEVKMTGKPVLDSLMLSDATESNIAHEFVHLFAQPAFMWTHAFSEGHAYAIQSTLYPRSEKDKPGANSWIKDKDVNEFFNMGLDHDQLELKFKAGLRSSLLNRMARAKWEIEWKEFVEKDPDFFKKFYEEISKQKKEGKFNFAKKELVQTAKDVSPDFAKWYENNNCMKNIGEDGEGDRKVVKFIRSEGTLFVSYITRFKRKMKGNRVVPAFVNRRTFGRFKIRGKSSGIEATVEPKSWDHMAVSIELPDALAAEEDLEVIWLK